MTTEKNLFNGSDIDRAIVMTQYDLRGFAHPLGFRSEHMSSPKGFNATVANFLAFAYGESEHLVNYYKDFTYDEYLSECKRLHESCELSRREAIQLIIKEMLKQHKEFESDIKSGKREKTGYISPLNKENRQGIVLLCLAETFAVVIEE